MPNAHLVESEGMLSGAIQGTGNLSGSVDTASHILGAVQITRRLDDHRLLTNRDAANQHPISAISALSDRLDAKVESDNAMTNLDIDNILRRFV